MNAQELRIGNWHYHNPNPGVPCKINHCSDLDKMRLLYCDPIPLTEDWLLKFGFEKETEGKPWYYINHDALWSLYIDIENSGLEYHLMSEEDIDEITAIDLAINIKHVHQLQNLYFALTGEELKINEAGDKKI